MQDTARWLDCEKERELQLLSGPSIAALSAAACPRAQCNRAAVETGRACLFANNLEEALKTEPELAAQQAQAPWWPCQARGAPLATDRARLFYPFPMH